MSGVVVNWSLVVSPRVFGIWAVECLRRAYAVLEIHREEDQPSLVEGSRVVCLRAPRIHTSDIVHDLSNRQLNNFIRIFAQWRVKRMGVRSGEALHLESAVSADSKALKQCELGVRVRQQVVVRGRSATGRRSNRGINSPPGDLCTSGA